MLAHKGGYTPSSLSFTYVGGPRDGRGPASGNDLETERNNGAPARRAQETASHDARISGDMAAIMITGILGIGSFLLQARTSSNNNVAQKELEQSRAEAARVRALAAVQLGLGRIVVLYYYASPSYRNS
jgi:hypothetical protein